MIRVAPIPETRTEPVNGIVDGDFATVVEDTININTEMRITASLNATRLRGVRRASVVAVGVASITMAETNIAIVPGTANVVADEMGGSQRSNVDHSIPVVTGLARRLTSRSIIIIIGTRVLTEIIAEVFARVSLGEILGNEEVNIGNLDVNRENAARRNSSGTREGVGTAQVGAINTIINTAGINGGTKADTTNNSVVVLVTEGVNTIRSGSARLGNTTAVVVELRAGGIGVGGSKVQVIKGSSPISEIVISARSAEVNLTTIGRIAVAIIPAILALIDTDTTVRITTPVVDAGILITQVVGLDVVLLGEGLATKGVVTERRPLTINPALQVGEHERAVETLDQLAIASAIEKSSAIAGSLVGLLIPLSILKRVEQLKIVSVVTITTVTDVLVPALISTGSQVIAAAKHANRLIKTVRSIVIVIVSNERGPSLGDSANDGLIRGNSGNVRGDIAIDSVLKNNSSLTITTLEVLLEDVVGEVD